MSVTHEIFQEYVVPTYARFPQSFVRGEGVWIWDETGNRYLDMGAGIAVASLGHAHPALAKAVQTQASTLLHCSNLYHIPQQGLLAKRLCEDVIRTPGKVFFSNSGAEANEALYKLARAFGHQRKRPDGHPRCEIITFTNSFHGRTLAGLAATGQEKIKKGFGPPMPGFRHLPYNDVAALEKAVTLDTTAIMLEMVQGESGINAATPEFLQTISQLCQQHDLLLLVDEIQAGLGRTGHLCSWESILGDLDDLHPDAVSWAKGLGGGFPLGATWIRKRETAKGGPDLCDLLGPGTHGTTFGGTPLGATAALVVIDHILNQALPTNAVEIGHYLRKNIQSWKHPAIKHVRGLGLMLGIVLNEDWIKKSPVFRGSPVPPAPFLVSWLNSDGLLTVPAKTDVIRLLPALNINKEEADIALQILQTTLERLDGRISA